MRVTYSAGLPRRATGIAGVVLLGAVLAIPGSARANEYTINACQADRTEFSTQAFDDFANRGMMWKRACNPEGPGLRGLVTSNVVRAGRVVRGSRWSFVLTAPAGDPLRSIYVVWTGAAPRLPIRPAAMGRAPRWADGGIKNVRANRGCPNRGKTHSGRMAIGPHLQHRRGDEDRAASALRRIRRDPVLLEPQAELHPDIQAAATVVDVSPPGVTITQDNAFTRGEWVSGRQQVDYAVLDNVGVRAARAIVAGVPRADSSRPCNYAQRVPCTNGPGSIPVDTSRLSEGTQPLAVQAEDAAANLGGSSPTTVRIDNTAPGAVPVAIDGGDVWRNRNDFDIGSANPDEGDRAPITASRYRLCPSVEPAHHRWRPGEVDHLANLSVPSAGEWHLSIWREDAAGNHQPANASSR